ncbi:MAG: hypothetical protein EPN31_15640 [Castellaniella sp.]|uniref:hypothetical protein n=1 Tax=Castellaniella sp. TaxID=1955812 RepID=UPI00120CD6A9|nr:hypothetical protein [Castellaniella sp.]TAN25291.1 MAG: hypothetical protein EPN31_15640 [Castellaniella sp.]
MKSTESSTNYDSVVPERYLSKSTTLEDVLNFLLRKHLGFFGFLLLALGIFLDLNALILSGSAVMIAGLISVAIRIHALAYKYDKPT